MIHDLVQRLRPRAHFQYALLSQLQPALCLDVGAAAGSTARAMRRAAPNTRVMAFEPFPGNWSFLEKAAAECGGIEIVRSAVSDRAGAQKFYVPSIVQGTENSWQSMAGYSSVGFLIPENAKLDAAKTIEVETVVLDDLVKQPVGMLKIDVQGGELGVLKGARQLITQHGVDLIFAEFTGDRRVLDLLISYGYDIYDCAYVIFDEKCGVQELLKEPGTIAFSTGASGYEGYLGAAIPRDSEGYCAFFRPGFQTDLLAVRQSAFDLEAALSKL